MGFPGLSPRFLHFSPWGHPEDGKAQVTREPTGHPEADGARGPSRPPRPRPTRAASDPWSGTAPGFEFEGRRSRPGWGPKRPQPGQPGQDQDPRGRPGRPQRRDTPPPDEPRRFRYTPTVSQPLSAPPQAWPDDDELAMPGFEFDDQPPNVAPTRVIPLTREPGPHQAAPTQPGPHQAAPTQPGPHQAAPTQPGPHQAAPTQPGPHQAAPTQPGPRQAAPTQPGPRQAAPTQPGPRQARPDPRAAAPSGRGCCARCCPSQPNAAGPGSSWLASTSGAGGSGSRSPSSPWSSSVSPSS